ncbi:hypothetical protein IPM19_02230 [bacterium]|nr:MAG: hypothetical protein IPM19_02230 [bacterium]
MKDLKLFNTVQPVQFVNEEDARFSDLQDRIGLYSYKLVDLAESNLEEVQARQSILMWLLNNSSLLEKSFFRYGMSGSIDGYKSDATIPRNASSFLAYAQFILEKRTAFWQRIKQFNSIDDSLYRLPQRIQNLSNYLATEGAVKYEEEMALTRRMIAELRESTAIQGVLKFSVESRTHTVRFEKDESCYGTWYYHPCVDPLLDPSSGAVVKFLNKIKPVRWLIKKTKDAIFYVKKGVAQIRETPESIIEDVRMFLVKKCQEDADFAALGNCSITVGYVFDHTGLTVSLLDWKYNKISSRGRELYEPDHGLAVRERSADKVSKKMSQLLRLRYKKQLDVLADKVFVENCGPIEIPCKNAQQAFADLSFQDIWDQYEEEISDLRQWQKDVIALFKDLGIYSDLAHMIMELELPYCFPKIVEQGAIQFERFYPIRVRTEAKTYCEPFSGIEIDDKVVNITGANGSGKSTVMLAVLDNLMLAHCGLPVFAADAQVILLEHIMLSFLDRDSDKSTFTAKFEKDVFTMQSLEKLSKAQRAKTLIINDELGSATDPVEMLDLAKEYLMYLYDLGAHSITSSQIKELGIFVESAESGGIGKNLVIDKTYTIKPGLESGRPKEVAKRLGFDEIIKRKAVAA